MSMKKLAALVAAAAMFATLGLTGCASNNDASSSASPSSSAAGSASSGSSSNVTLNVIGSTSVEPLMTAIGDKYTSETGVKVQVQGNGSSAGIKAAQDGSADIGMSSRELKQEELDSGLETQTLALDGIAVIVNTKNPVKNLTVDQISKIFKGEITNWKDVGGNDQEILLAIREAGSGTRDAFEELCNLTEKQGDKTVSVVDESKAIVSDSTNALAQNVSSKENAIGYISLGSLDASAVTALEVDGVACTEENVQAGTYKISRPLLLVTKGAPSADAQALIDYAMSEEGQKVVTDKGFILAK